jgi:hypothetical protein
VRLASQKAAVTRDRAEKEGAGWVHGCSLRNDPWIHSSYANLGLGQAHGFANNIKP